MKKDKNKIDQEKSEENKADKDSLKDGFMAGLGGGAHGVHLANKEKENSNGKGIKNYILAILIVIAIGILIIFLVGLLFF